MLTQRVHLAATAAASLVLVATAATAAAGPTFDTAARAVTLSSASSGATSAIAVGDVNGDGLNDIVAASVTEHTVRVLLRDASAAPAIAFRSTSLGFAVRGAYAVRVADVDGDSRADIVVAGSGWPKDEQQQQFGTFYVFYQQAAADAPLAFERYTLQTREFPCAIDIADFDGDGLLDVLSLSEYDGTLAVHLHAVGADGRGAPRAFRAPTVLSTDVDGARDACAVDIDGDGHVDVLAGGWRSPLRMWLNRGDGITFTLAVVSPVRVWSIVAADFNCDGRVDVAAVPFRGAGALCTQVASAAFDCSSMSVSGTSERSITVAADGTQQCAHRAYVVSKRKESLRVMDHDPARSTLVQQRSYHVGRQSSVRVVDVDGDGALDLLMGGDQVKLVLGDGQGSAVAAIVGEAVGGVIVGTLVLVLVAADHRAASAAAPMQRHAQQTVIEDN